MSKEFLKENLNEAEWSWIQPHALRDAVIVVGAPLELLVVGEQIANNNTQQVGEWIQQGLLRKPSKQEIQFWDQTPTQKFQTLIVQPYVLITVSETQVLHH